MKLAACCCYYNFNGYASRLRNYMTFRRSVESAGVELLTVELAAPDASGGGGGHELAHLPGVVPVVGDAMWQKERLWQFGGELLVERGYDAVLFLDADTVYAQGGWPRIVAESLDGRAILQAFETIEHVFDDRTHRHRSALAQRKFRPARGGAFAARAEFIMPPGPGFYQHCVAGSGDGALCLALLRGAMHPDWFRIRSARVNFLASPAMRRHWRSWADRVHTAVGSRWGYAPLHAVAMPHGALTDRHYTKRNRLLADFDPQCDVEVRGGAFWWTCRAAKPEMIAGVADYFDRRREDGQPQTVAVR